VVTSFWIFTVRRRETGTPTSFLRTITQMAPTFETRDAFYGDLEKDFSVAIVTNWSLRVAARVLGQTLLLVKWAWTRTPDTHVSILGKGLAPLHRTWHQATRHIQTRSAWQRFPLSASSMPPVSRLLVGLAPQNV
jgi:hypothetical protein